ncbi:peptidylprolyl isomerase [Pyxidicoccus fallax]|uniref:Peptidylprolyl isomerase n=1 Tax=Pyxidicoccus fallax TaxID=394095 RepID=A0A848LR94_9BACT|nr:peptidylprolyl isomerase [Pyxidicoccus fallax]NMO20427.1 peptidylprolyl isomerase [Pyxidicoccus fallax]NPC86667.1 peptidylprolyl isomerase [Pyxidicoccus fallax]
MTTKDDSKGGGGARSLAELHALGIMKRMPAAYSLDSTEPVDLPFVLPPSLEGLTVALVPPEPLTEQDLVERFDALRHQHANRRDRQPGEDVGAGDEVLLDILGFANGKLMPFSTRENWWVHVSPDPVLPGFFEALVGAKVGQSFGIELTLPATYPVESLRGQQARFLLDVKAARELKLLEDDSPELLKRLGMGTLTDVMRHLADDLAREHTEEMDRRTQERVLDVLVERANVELPAKLVDEEIRRRWAETERPILARKDFQPDELQEALEGWLNDPLTRADAARRLALALILRAIAERDGVQPDRKATDALIDDLASLSNVSRQELGRSVKEDPALARKLYDLALHLATVDHVMKKVKLTAPAP